MMVDGSRRLHALSDKIRGKRTSILIRQIKHLPGIQQPLRIHTPLQRPHHINRRMPQFIHQTILLPDPNGMLPADRPFHLQGTIHHIMHQFTRPVFLLFIVGIVEHGDVEVAVADVTDYAGEDAEVGAVLLGDVCREL